MSRVVRRRIADVKRAVAAARDPKNLVGRWALLSGAAFTIRWIDVENGRALCGGDGRRWWLTITDLHAMLDLRQLRYLGRAPR